MNFSEIIEKYSNFDFNSQDFLQLISNRFHMAIKIANGPFIKMDESFTQFFFQFHQNDIKGKYYQDIFPSSIAEQFDRLDREVIDKQVPDIMVFPLDLDGVKKYFVSIHMPLKVVESEKIILLNYFEIRNLSQEKSVEKMSDELIDRKGLFDLTRDLQSVSVTGTEFRMDQNSNVLNKTLSDLTKIVSEDKLTGIYNRRKFEEYGEEEIKRSNRYRFINTLIVIDIDYFKMINDTYGHIKGDHILRELVEVMKRNLRETDFMARWGGDEFIIIIPLKEQDAFRISEKIRKDVENHTFSIPQKITVSIGISQYNYNDTLTQWFENSDKALYQAKGLGRNRVITFDRFKKE